MKIDMDSLRKGDVLKFENGEEAKIESIAFRMDDKKYYIDLGTKVAFRFDSEGKCEFPAYNISEVVLVETEDDKITYYVPNIFWQLTPVVSITVKGAKKPLKQTIVKSVFELDGMGPFYHGEIIKAEILPVVYAELRKCKGRDVSILKTEKIFCKDEKEAVKTVETFKEKYLVAAEEKSNDDTGSEVKTI